MTSATAGSLSGTSGALLRALEMEVACAQRERQAKRLAAGLMRQLGIAPHGIDMVCWLSDASCRNNADAMARWIVRQLADAGYEAELLYQPDCEVLLKRLNRYLSYMEAANA
jgi:hypothetical protein